METLATVRARYERYLQTVAELRGEKGPYRDLLGFGGGVKTDHCHAAFLEELTSALSAPKQAEAGELPAIVSYILHAPEAYERDGLLCWTFIAAQQAVLPLIGSLEPAQAAELADWYGRAFPRVKRAPVQDRILARLRKQTGTHGEK